MFRTLCLSLILALLSGCSSLLLKPESEWTVEDFYQKAKTEFDSEQWSMAIEYYEKLKANFPYGTHAEQSYLELAYAYYRYDEPQSAIRELEEFIRLYPKHSELAYAHYLKAVAADSINQSWLDKFITDPASRDAKSTKEAYRAYQQVVQKFPDSQYAQASQQRLIILTNRLARRELQIAEYYFKRKAYLAAANRAEASIKNYPLAQSNKAALKLMKAAYQELGMQNHAQSVEQVQELNP
jgi:outer membrane protein assembly factor BamD